MPTLVLRMVLGTRQRSKSGKMTVEAVELRIVFHGSIIDDRLRGGLRGGLSGGGWVRRPCYGIEATEIAKKGASRGERRVAGPAEVGSGGNVGGRGEEDPGLGLYGLVFRRCCGVAMVVDGRWASRPLHGLPRRLLKSHDDVGARE